VQVKTPGSVLIGGLGLGFTLRGVLDRVSSSTRVVVAELVPALIEWNRQHVGHLANHPLQDPRCQIINQDVFEQISGADGAFDAILLDVDNGPAALAETSNQRLYSKRGARHCLASLRPEGVLAVWSAGPSERYRNVLASAGFGVEVLRVPSSTKGRGSHVLFLATARPLHPGRGMINGAT
jgi:spermidine synthase